MAKISYQKLSPDALSKTGAAIGFICWLAGIGFHGFLGFPSMMSDFYGVRFMMPGVLFGSLIALVVGGFILGWLIATIYNQMLD